MHVPRIVSLINKHPLIFEKGDNKQENGRKWKTVFSAEQFLMVKQEWHVFMSGCLEYPAFCSQGVPFLKSLDEEQSRFTQQASRAQLSLRPLFSGHAQPRRISSGCHGRAPLPSGPLSTPVEGRAQMTNRLWLSVLSNLSPHWVRSHVLIFQN